MSIRPTIKLLASNSMIYGLGNILSKLSAFFLIPIYTRYLSMTEVGIIALLEMAELFIVTIVPLGLINAVWRYLPESTKKEKVKILSSAFWGINGMAVIPLNTNFDYLDLSIVGVGEEIIIAYVQQSINMNGDIYAMRIDANGNSIWAEGNVVITNSNDPKSDMIIGKGQGCIFIAWTEDGNVYAHYLKEDGTLGAPDSSIAGDVNGDGEINVLDIVQLVGFILGSSNPSDTQINSGDLNVDGVLNVLDVFALVNIILTS